mgnify:CR=1 FL=1|tara:strand:- start:8316 stop:8633 length:318 start_codon:yes stop_codon:yes gene_type:complete
MDIYNTLRLTFPTQLIEEVEKNMLMGLNKEPETINETLIIDINDIKYFRFSLEETIVGLYKKSNLSNIPKELVVIETEKQILEQIKKLPKNQSLTNESLTNLSIH